MSTELQALLVVQADDVIIHGLEQRIVALEPRIRELDARRNRVAEAIARSTQAVQAEEQRQAFLRDKIAEHKQLIEKNQAQMDAVKTMKQATAAAAQLEQARRIVQVEEGDLLALNRRLDELRGALTTQKKELDAIEAEQETARSEVAAERAAIDGELSTAREKRATSAKAVPGGLLSKYDRIRGRKRVEAVVAMRGMACGACDTAIPMQRRHVMTATAAIELCEACGVLMYFVAGDTAAT